MSRDDEKEKTPSPEPSHPSRMQALEEVVSTLEQAIHTLPQLSESVQRLWEKSALVFKVEASRSDHVVTLANAVQQSRQSSDRQTDAILALTREMSEIKGHYATIVAGLEFLAPKTTVTQTTTTETRAKDSSGSETTKSETVVTLAALKTADSAIEALRENTGSQRLLDENEDTVDRKLKWIERVLHAFGRLRPLTQALLLFVIILAFAALFGWGFYKLHATAETPQGLPLPAHSDH